MSSTRLALVALVAACAAPSAVAEAAPPDNATTSVDRFSLETGRLGRSEIQLLTVSAPPGAVSGGQALFEVRGVRPGERLRLTRNGTAVRRDFARVGSDTRRGSIGGLRRGANQVVAEVDRGGRKLRARLRVANHSIRGPIISGPQQKPFFCRTEDAGLGAARDTDCSAAARVEWFYRSALDQGYERLDDPFAPYPGDVMRTTTSSGETVPWVVRVESRTINRGITRIAVLDDPAARGREAPLDPAWNGRMTYAFGESCGVGYQQGRNSVSDVLGGLPVGLSGDSIFATIYGLADRIGEGDVVAISTMTTFGVYCNPLVSAESLMMIQEHVAEQFGAPIERVVGVGGSGGALQQYNAVNNYPGLLDGALPVASFTDIPSTAMTVVDCGLLGDYWRSTALDWSDAQKAAVAGHRTARICPDWEDTFLSRLDPARGCDGAVPDEVRYDRLRNPDGVRCTLQDATASFWGRDRETGFARRPYDNVGVQYGLRALRSGAISPEQFVDLNRRIGGFDLDARNTAARTRMEPAVARRAYRFGLVIGRGSLPRTPVIDLATYLDLIPVADIHDIVRPFQVRARLAQRTGSTASQSIWRGVSTPPDGRIALDEWIDQLEDSDAAGRPAAVRTVRPPAAQDSCVLAPAGSRADLPDGLTLPLGPRVPLAPDAASGSSPGLAFPIGAFIPNEQKAGEGVCDAAFPAISSVRTQAGGPFADDKIKCRRKPVDPGDYRGALRDTRIQELRAIFRDGVCDWSKPAVGDVERSIVWPSLGDGRGNDRPSTLRWRAASSG